MAVLHLTCGKIACGKTFYAKKICENNKALLFSVDEMMLTLHDSCLGSGHSDAESRCVEFLLNLACEAVKCGLDAVLDFGFWKSFDRIKASQFCLDNKINFEWHFFDTDITERKKRLELRNSLLLNTGRREYIIDEEMLARFDSWFEYPIENELMTKG